MVLYKNILFLLACIFSISANAQSYKISGQIKDADTKEVLPFVNIVINSGNHGGISDINGVFNLESNEPIQYLRISYVGYISDTIYLNKGQNFVNIELKKNVIELNEVIILPGENPAHRIIDSAVAHRKENDPFALNSFTYNSYGKFYITVEIDSLIKTPDHLLDTESIQIKNFFEEHYLFFMENLTKRMYKKPSLDNETVIASKVSGFSDPLFTLLMSQIQSFAFYEDLITISDKNYVNPISKGSTNKYFFLLEDTIYDGADSVFVISYRPKRNKNFDALQGVLYIHTDNWALQSVIAEPMSMKQGMSVKIKQNYSRPDGKTWFPSQLHTEIYFANINFDKYPIFGRGITQIYNVDINPELKRKDFPDATVSIEPDAHEKDEKYWNENRPDTLTKKEINTYNFIDSLGKKENFDRLLDITMVLIEGKIPISLLSLDINKIYTYNEVEGSRLGLGLTTNYKVSKKWVLGGYYAYGFKDEKHKFGGNLKVYINKSRDFYIKAIARQDARESGSIIWGDETTNNIFDAEGFRSFLLTRAEYFREYRLSMNFKIGKNISMMPSIGNTFSRNFDNILFGSYQNGEFVGSSAFEFNDISLYTRIAFGEKIVSSENYNLLLGNPKLHPTIQIQLQKAIPGLLNGDLDFWSVRAKVSQTVKSKYLGTSSYKVEGGFCSNDIPISLSFNAPASYRQFTIASPNSFETMRMNEFYNTRFLFVFLKHSFDHLIFGNGKFAPVPEIITNIGWGTYTGNEYIQYPVLKTLKNPYLESGFFMNNLLNLSFYSLGIGVVYRYGYHHLPRLEDNFTYKISFSTVL